MSKNEIIEKLAKQKTIENIIKKYNSSMYADDLAQDLYISLLNKDDELIERLYNENTIEFYIRKMIRLNLNSSTSQFYNTYKKYNKLHINIDDLKI